MYKQSEFGKRNNIPLYMLLHADAIAVIGRSPDDLQCMLDTLNLQCKRWRVLISTDKAKCIHFWRTRSKLSNFEFTVGSNSIYVSCLHIKVISQKCRKPCESFKSTNFKKIISIIHIKNDFRFNAYEKLYYSWVITILDHAGSVWGYKRYQSIDIIQYGLFGI